MPEILLAAVCVAVAVAVVGHGLWVFAAWILRGGQPRDATKGPAGARRCCPRCGLPLEADRCVPCDWPAPKDLARRRPHAALAVLKKQVEALRGLRVFDPEAYKNFSELIAAEHERLAAMGRISSAVQAEAADAEVVAEVVDVPLPTAPAAAAVTAPLPDPEAIVPAVRQPAEQDDREFPSDVPLAERAAAFTARRQQPRPATVPQLPVAPARSWTDLLAAFMEERNMRWGELIGGLLIVCCSVALVISFWSAIAERSWLKFFVFNGVTAALFGVGLHSEHRWRLRTTSQGLLLIGSMLVPLNFLAIAAFSSAPSTAVQWSLAGEALSTALFATLVYWAGKVLLDSGSPWLVVAILVPSLAQLLVRRFVDDSTSVSVLAALVAIPLACYLAVNAWLVRRTAGVLSLGEEQVNSVFKFIGLSTFAALLPLALLQFKTGDPLGTARQLPFVLCLLGVAPLAVGLVLWRKLAGRQLTNLRIAGTSLAVIGALASVSGLVIAWPDPRAMLPAALLEFAIFTFVALRSGLPAAHVVAAGCLALAYLLGCHVADHQIDWVNNVSRQVAASLVSGQSGTLLAPLSMFYAAVAWLVGTYRGRTYFAIAAALLAGISVGLVSWFGFAIEGDPTGAAWVYLLYAAGCLAVAARRRTAAIPWLGAALLLAAVVQGVVFRYGENLALVEPEVTALLVYCTAAAAIAMGARWSGLAREESLLDAVLWNAVFACSLVVAGWLVVMAAWAGAELEAGNWLWLSLVWLAVALATGWQPVAALFQIALTATAVYAVATQLEQQVWFRESPARWLDPWTLEAVGIALAGLNLAWATARIGCRRLARSGSPAGRAARLQAALASEWLGFDRVTSGALVALLIAIVVYAALPGVAQELSPRAARVAATATAGVDAMRVVPPASDFEWRSVPHEHAAGWGSWLLLASVALLVATLARETAAAGWLLCLIVTAAAICPLAASGWESQVAVASALRWLSAGLLVVGSLPLWGRAWIARQAQYLGWPTPLGSHFVTSARALVFFLGLFPPLAMAVYVGVAALEREGRGAVLWSDSFGFVVVWAVALLAAGAFLLVPKGLSRSDDGRARPTWPWAASALALVLGTAPLVAIVLYHVGVALGQSPILGPDPGSIFARMGLAASYAIPVIVTALVLVGHAMRERSSGFGLAGGLVLGAGATAAYLLAVAKGGVVFDAAQWIRLAQLNAAVGACYALAWLAVLVRARRDRSAPLAGDFLLSTQVALGPALLAIVLGAAWGDLVWRPQGSLNQPYVMNVELADVWGWASLALASASVCAAMWTAGKRLSVTVANAFLTALVIMAAAIAAYRDMGNLVSYNTLLVGHGLVATGLLLLIWRQSAGKSHAGADTTTVETGYADALQPRPLWIVVQGAIVLVLSVRELTDGGWWPALGTSFLAAFLAPALAWVCQRRRYLYMAAALFDFAGLLIANVWNVFSGLEDFAYLNVILLALPIGGWLAIESRRIRSRPFRPTIEAVPVHRLAMRVALAMLTALVGLALVGDATQSPLVAPTHGLDWIALAAVGIAALACLWDAGARDALAALYLLGLTACGRLLHQYGGLTPAWLLWMGALVTASYALATSYLWSVREGLAWWAARAGIPRRGGAEFAGLAWLVPCNLLLVAAVVVMTFVVQQSNLDARLRLLAAQATLTQVASVALLARGDRRGVLQTIALVVGAIGAVLLAWAPLEPGTTFTLLHALVDLAAALAVVGVFYGFGLGKLLRDSSDWLAPARRLTPWLTALSGGAIAATLCVEIIEYIRSGEIQIALPAIIIVAVTLGGLCVAALAAAILPGRDPLGLSERGRTLYVYGAEIILALLFVHIRLTLPWLFAGYFRQYWPLAVMAIAFLGVGVAEVCRRRKQMVLADPIENTGVLLPVLPVLGFWAGGTNVHYSLLLLLVGVFYGGLSIARRSFGFGVLAALAANGGLWYFLDRQEGWEFLAHPQVWLIPPALCVLAAAYLNRRQLSEEQMTSIRYFTSLTVYLSSTGDIFLNGVADAPWLPLVLGGLSVVGILAGMLLRVRAFLFLGTGFLILALLTIIYHAAVDLEQTWIWWASGVVLGVIIVALFGVFEKKRQQVLEIVELVKRWDA